jgi:LytS/YehU family sensor histidine kinase
MEALASKPLVAGVVPVSLAYVIWIVMRFYKREKLRGLALEAERVAHAWAALSAQIKPHFLFNTLSSLEQLVAVDPMRAKAGISHLAALYRRVLEASKHTSSSVSEEVKLVEDYLAIQAIRFQDRLLFEIETADDVKDAAVPATLLLTLAENAVKHGIEPSIKGGDIVISIRKRDGNLSVSVSNPKCSGAAPLEGTGHGLEDVRKRLALLFGDAARFAFSTVDDRVATELEMPLTPVSKGDEA